MGPAATRAASTGAAATGAAAPVTAAVTRAPFTGAAATGAAVQEAALPAKRRKPAVCASRASARYAVVSKRRDSSSPLEYKKINVCAAYIGIGGMKIEDEPRH